MLCEMTRIAYSEIRQLAEAGKSEQSFELAAAFHQLLDNMWSDEFDLASFRKEVSGGYQLKFPGPPTVNYVTLIDRIIALRDDDHLKS